MNRAPRQTQRSPMTAPIRRVRFAWVALLFCFWAVLIGGRLVWLQVIRHAEWVDKAERQQHSAFEVAPQRGVLYDRNLRELAMTVQVDSIFAVPTELGDNQGERGGDAGQDRAHRSLATSSPPQQQMLARFNDSRNFAWVARRVDAATADRVRELNLKGVYFQKEFKRFYPNNDLAAQVLGYVGTEDTGLGGLEREVRRRPAWRARPHADRSRRQAPRDGQRGERAAAGREPGAHASTPTSSTWPSARWTRRWTKVKALHGTVVVQDPHTGQILALAISPRFNPNDSRHMEPGVADRISRSAMSTSRARPSSW